MKKRRILLWTLILSLILAVTTAGCGPNGGQSGSQSESAKKEPIKIGISPWPGWYAWYLVQDLGFFKKHGVDVQLVWFPVYSDSLQAMTTGKLDGNSEALSDTLAPLSKGINQKIVLVNDNSAGGDGLVVKPQYKSVKDLKGKQVVTEMGTLEHLLLLTALERNGMTDKDIQFTNMTVNDAGPAFISGNVDAAVLWEPFLSKAISQGKGVKIFSSKDTPGLIPDLLVMNGDVVKNRRDDVQKIVAAWFDAMNYWKAHPEEAIAIMAKHAETNTKDYAQLAQGTKIFTLDDNLNAFAKKDDLTSLGYSAKKTGEFLMKVKMLDSNPDLEKALDPSFVQALKK